MKHVIINMDNIYCIKQRICYVRLGNAYFHFFFSLNWSKVIKVNTPQQQANENDKKKYTNLMRSPELNVINIEILLQQILYVKNDRIENVVLMKS